MHNEYPEPAGFYLPESGNGMKVANACRDD